MREKSIGTMRKEHELMLTEIMLLKDEVRKLNKLLEIRTPQQQTIKVKIDKPFDYDGWLP